MQEKHLDWRGPMALVMLMTLILAILSNYLFFEQRLGVSYPLFVMLFYACFLSVMKEKITTNWDFRGFLFAVIIALSMTYGLFTNQIFHVINFLVIPTLILIHTTLLSSHRAVRWFDKRIVWNVLDHLFPQTFRHFSRPFKFISAKMGSRTESQTKKTVVKVITGLLISVPLLFVVTLLLSSADEAFERLLSTMFSGIDSFSFTEGVLRAIWIGVLFVFLFGYLWGFKEPVTYDWEAAGHKDVNLLDRIVWDPVIVATILIAVNVVYMLFAAVQFSYLFGAWSGELPSGMTYAEHARSGFFELVMVTIINFGLMAGVLTFTRGGRMLLQSWNRVLMSLLIGCTAVMLISAFVRLQLYEQVYGYTYIRFLVHAFMIFLGIMLIFAGYRVWSERISLLHVFVIAGLLAYVTVNFVGMDSIIAQKNMKRYLETGMLDAAYLNELSWEAVPDMVEMSSKNEEISRYLQEKYEWVRKEKKDWRSFNWSRYQAEKVLVEYMNNKKLQEG